MLLLTSLTPLISTQTTHRTRLTLQLIRFTPACQRLFANIFEVIVPRHGESGPSYPGSCTSAFGALNPGTHTVLLTLCVHAEATRSKWFIGLAIASPTKEAPCQVLMPENCTCACRTLFSYMYIVIFYMYDMPICTHTHVHIGLLT